MKALTIKRLLGGVFRLFRKNQARRVVLLYHAVGDGPDACPTKRFAEHMTWLARNAQVLPLDALLEGHGTAPLQVAITFDDGYASVAQVAAPIMERLDLTGTVYLTAACIGNDEASRQASNPASGHLNGERFMIWPETRALQASGWQIGSHGLDHVDMTVQIPDALESQLQSSKHRIESNLGVPCHAFAYPWGRNIEQTRQAVHTAGYAHAAGTLHGPLCAASPQLAFPRIDVRRDYATDDVESMLRGDWDFLGAIQSIRRRCNVRS